MKEEPLIKKIADILKKNPMGLSIAAFERKIKQDGDKGIHRVYLGGYLKAFAEMGILEEMDYKPSKVFRLKRKAMDKFGDVMETILEIDQSHEDIKMILVDVQKKEDKLTEQIDKVIGG